jgi:putative heme-binding domain-containing protein
MNLVASDDEWAAPIMAEVGPDGNVWVIDWYNYIVQHNPTPIGFENGPGNAYVTDLRDKKHGRIYRVVYGDDPKPLSLADASSEALVAALKHPNMFWRRHAQRLLIERGDLSVAPALRELVGAENLDAIGLDVGAIHALRTLDGLGQLASSDNLTTLADALKHRSPGVVRTAIEVLPRNEAGLNLLIDAEAIASSDPQVRLSALLALAEMPGSEGAAKMALDALVRIDHRNDRWMLDAATSAAANNGGDFLRMACQQSEAPTTLRDAAVVVAEHVARSTDVPAVTGVLEVLANATPEVRAAIIEGWANGWPQDSQIELAAETDAKVMEVFDRLDTGSKGQLIRLAKAWGSKSLADSAKMIADSLLEIAEDEDAPSADRVDAASELVGLMSDDAGVVSALLDCVSPRMDQQTAIGIVNALQRSRSEDAGKLMIERMADMTPATREATIRVMLSRPETTVSLLGALESGQLGRSDLALDQQQALLAHPSRRIRRQAEEVLSSSGGLPSPDRTAVLESLMNVTTQKGDVAKGKVVFVKNCANCHMHRGEGTKVGPDLTGMAVHPKAELLTHIIDPSRSVEGNYRSYSVLTLDGIVINGMLASETKTAIEIFDAQGKKQVVLREDIEQLIGSNKSVMPEGFEKQIDTQGFADLLEFLTDKGRYLPLPLEKVASAVSTKGLFHDGDNGPDRIVFPEWKPVMVGEVPFQLIDPQGKRVPNIVLLNGPQGSLPPKMPKTVSIPCNTPVNAIHLLSGVSGWGFPAHREKSVSMTVRLRLADGSVEDHPLRNAVHFADYIRRVDVPESAFAMMVGGQQLRHVTVKPETDQTVESIELVKGDDPTAPIVVAVTIEPKPTEATH